ncbi:hypothetical protein [Deinococcus sedimenti]|uniref:Uncharacterized protein n=1 Tax=Deinococcus sedimenti TaxID=1867090 RepID=A0ABQ2SAX1_9DEIO|nr:hypothetical protein [Deinococcus sedimenti]GGS09158.1 hypothetical protein GCM10008960_39320 [Deinococcus sedimenti]
MPDPDRAPDRDAPLTSTPRWVKVFGWVGALVLLLAVVALLSSGQHGPGRHFTPSSTSSAP